MGRGKLCIERAATLKSSVGPGPVCPRVWTRMPAGVHSAGRRNAPGLRAAAPRRARSLSAAAAATIWRTGEMGAVSIPHSAGAGSSEPAGNLEGDLCLSRKNSPQWPPF